MPEAPLPSLHVQKRRPLPPRHPQLRLKHAAASGGGRQRAKLLLRRQQHKFRHKCHLPHRLGTFGLIKERAIYCVFKFLPLQSIISVFEAVLLEKKIIFVSQSRTILGFAIEAFLAFVFPFRWEHVLIPILPAPLKEYLAAPVPIIVGITPAMVDNTIEADVRSY